MHHDELSPRATWRSPDLGTARAVAAGGGELAVFESGTVEGPPIVFVHGLLVNANLWRRVVPLLSDDHRCLTVDLPFGSHRAPWSGADLTPPGLAALVIGAIEQLGGGPVTLVGNDSGGAVCQLVATQRPDLISALVLTSCDAYEHFPPPSFAYLRALPRVPGAMGMLAALRFRPLRRFPLAYGWLSSGRLPADAGDSYALPVVESRRIRADLRQVLLGLDRRHTLAAAAAFDRVTAPVLLAWSEADKIFHAHLAERLAGDLPDAELAWIPGARTLSPEDEPERLTELVRQFLARRRVA